MWRKLPITSITPFTFLDYPGHTACILWFSGCNMACGYCHNPELVKGELRRLPGERIARFLDSRRDKLEGVVLSGGECTLSPALPDLARHLKGMGFKVKVDTNGTQPDRLAAMLAEELVDFVALDMKAPRARFADVTGIDAWHKVMRSLCLITSAAIGREVRTTVHTGLIGREDIEAVMGELAEAGYHGRYVIQNFRQGRTLGGLGAPARPLDLKGLAAANLEIVFRNFPEKTEAD